MNLKAIADAIAGRFTGVTATVDGKTESIRVGPTASLPDALADGPALLVYHPTGALDVGVSQLRSDTYDFPVRLLRQGVRYGLRSDALYAWATALRDRVEMNMDLDLAYVAWAQPVGMRVELDGENYAGDLYDVVEIDVRVRLYESVSTVAA